MPIVSQRDITVTLSANGGAFADGEETKTVELKYDEDAKAYAPLKFDESDPTYSGYKLAGWSATSDVKAEYTTEKEITFEKDTTLYAVWAEAAELADDKADDSQHTITLNANGGV